MLACEATNEEGTCRGEVSWREGVLACDRHAPVAPAGDEVLVSRAALKPFSNPSATRREAADGPPEGDILWIEVRMADWLRLNVILGQEDPELLAALPEHLAGRFSDEFLDELRALCKRCPTCEAPEPRFDCLLPEAADPTQFIGCRPTPERPIRIGFNDLLGSTRTHLRDGDWYRCPDPWHTA